MIIDTHIHLDDESFDEDRELLIEEFQKNNIGKIVNIGADIKTSMSSIELSQLYDMVYAVIGVHPSEVHGLDENALSYLKSMASHPKVLAIGEIGLDYYWEKDREIQKQQQFWYQKQMELAYEAGLPIVIHSRDAAKDTLDITKTYKNQIHGGVVHCYSYGVDIAREYLNMGFFFGIGGVLTFSNARKLKEVVEYLPLENIVLETDAPYLAPVPYRGKRNSSLYIPYVVQAIADIKGFSPEYIIEKTMENAYQLYPKLRR